MSDFASSSLFALVDGGYGYPVRRFSLFQMNVDHAYNRFTPFAHSEWA